MRSGNYDVSLIADSVVLDEMQVDGKTYVCSEPGKEYHVMISVYRDPVTKQFPCPYLRFGLYVDGIDVQYWKRLDLSNEHDLPSDPKVPVIVKFWGFKQNVSELRSFVFTTPSYDGEVTSTSSSVAAAAAAAAPHVQQNAGRLKIVIYEARVTTGDFNNQQAAKQIQPATTFAAGNVKLLDQASMVTSTGQRIANEKEVFAPLQRWANVSTEPLQTIELHYHSRSMLRILANLTAQKKGQAGALNGGDDSAGDTSSRKRSLESSSPKDETDDGHGKQRRLGADFDPFTLNNGGGKHKDADDSDEDVVVVQKVVVAPLLDLTDDGDAPVWSSREIGS